MTERSSARSYESPLRAEQVERVRERILDAAMELVATDGHGDLTLRKVALRCGVSVPTVYRYFASPDDLSRALFDRMNTLLGFPDMPKDMEGAKAFAAVLYGGFERNDLLVRAYLQSPLRRQHQKTRYALLRQAVDNSLSGLPEGAQQDVAALVQLMLSGQTWVALHDNWGMNGQQAGELTAWAIQTLMDAARRAPHDVPGAAAAGGAGSRQPRKRNKKESP